MNDPFAFLRQAQESSETKARIKKISKTIKKNKESKVSEAEAQGLGQLLLGISNFEDIDIDTISDPEILHKIEILTKLKAFNSILESDAASGEALSYLRGLLFDAKIGVRDKIAAANSILNNKKKQQKEVYEFLEVFKSLFVKRDDENISSLSDDELLQSLSNVLSYVKK